ncbi:DUF1289 domain-containing protein [uncultured Halopseudomonas sp.]|uniref:DUF1289 domain-containing protein n=1 Tax=uncultured Halopseudomonas sp. TaxID=2901193 RepID=UPI0030EDF792|tara:strand:- start:35869 stop:36315 length:447 start_codon:yes stop_codon:yes gene_type:complete
MTEISYTSKTPCIGLCSTVYGDLVCRGCKRFSHEIIDWNRYQNDQKKAVWSRLEQLLTQLVMARIEVVSALELRGAMEARQLVFTEEQPISLQIWRLLSRADAPALEECGMRARAGYNGVNVKQLREEIDRDYFNLSEAYYQRHTVRL